MALSSAAKRVKSRSKNLGRGPSVISKQAARQTARFGGGGGSANVPQEEVPEPQVAPSKELESNVDLAQQEAKKQQAIAKQQKERLIIEDLKRQINQGQKVSVSRKQAEQIKQEQNADRIKSTLKRQGFTITETPKGEISQGIEATKGKRKTLIGREGDFISAPTSATLRSGFAKPPPRSVEFVSSEELFKFEQEQQRKKDLIQKPKDIKRLKEIATSQNVTNAKIGTGKNNLGVYGVGRNRFADRASGPLLKSVASASDSNNSNVLAHSSIGPFGESVISVYKTTNKIQSAIAAPGNALLFEIQEKADTGLEGLQTILEKQEDVQLKKQNEKQNDIVGDTSLAIQEVGVHGILIPGGSFLAHPVKSTIGTTRLGAELISYGFEKSTVPFNVLLGETEKNVPSPLELIKSFKTEAEKPPQNQPTMAALAEEFKASPTVSTIETIGGIIIAKKAFDFFESPKISKGDAAKISSREGYSYNINTRFKTIPKDERFGIIKEHVPEIKRVGAYGTIKGQNAKGVFYEIAGKIYEEVRKTYKGSEYVVKRTIRPDDKFATSIYKVNEGGKLELKGSFKGEVQPPPKSKPIKSEVNIQEAEQFTSKTPIREKVITAEKGAKGEIKKLKSKIIQTGKQEELLRRLSARQQESTKTIEITPEASVKVDTVLDTSLRARQTQPRKIIKSIVEERKEFSYPIPFKQTGVKLFRSIKRFPVSEKTQFYDLYLGKERYIGKPPIESSTFGYEFTDKGVVQTSLQRQKITGEISKQQKTTVSQNIKIDILSKAESKLVKKAQKVLDQTLTQKEKAYSKFLNDDFTDLKTWRDVYGDARKPVIDSEGRVLTPKSIRETLEKLNRKDIPIQEKVFAEIDSAYKSARKEIYAENPELAEAQQLSTIRRGEKLKLEKMIIERAEEKITGNPSKVVEVVELKLSEEIQKQINNARKNLQGRLNKKKVEELVVRNLELQRDKLRKKGFDPEIIDELIAEQEAQPTGNFAVDFSEPIIDVKIGGITRGVLGKTEIKPGIFVPIINQRQSPISQIRSNIRSQTKSFLEPISSLRSNVQIKPQLKSNLRAEQNLNIDLDIQQEIRATAKQDIEQEIETEIEQELKPELETETTPTKTPTTFNPFNFKTTDVILTGMSDDEDDKDKDRFIPEVRRSGVFTPLGTFPSIQQAFSSAKQRVQQTAAASFRIRGPEGYVAPKGLFNPRDFRPSKTEPFVFVEPRERRIKSTGELGEITFKGLAAIRAKKGGGIFGKLF